MNILPNPPISLNGSSKATQVRQPQTRLLFRADSSPKGKRNKDSIVIKTVKGLWDFSTFAFGAVMIGYGVASCSVLGLLVNDFLNSQNKQEISQSHDPTESQDITKLIKRMEKK